MGADSPMGAAELLNTEDERTLTSIFRHFGDEPHADRLAREIVRRRANAPFETSIEARNGWPPTRNVTARITTGYRGKNAALASWVE